MSREDNQETRDHTSLTRDTSFEEALEQTTLTQKLDRIAYGLVGSYFKGNDRFSWMQKRLDKANRAEDYDLYLSRTLLISATIGIFGLLMGGLAIGILQIAGILPQIDTGLRYPPAIAKFLWVIRPLLFAIVAGGLLYLLVTGISFIIGLYYPVYLAGSRKRRINNTLPHAVTFMYALSKGGMSTPEIMHRLAEAEGTYGTVSEEFRQIVKEMQMFSLGIPEALSRASTRTPSTQFEDFCDDLRGILESGANTTDFFQDKSVEYREMAEQEQESFLDTLELLGEVYVTAFVAGPLFMIIITVILALMGSGGPMQLYFIVYLILPLLNFVYFVFLDTITPDEAHLESTLEQEDTIDVSVEELEKRIKAVGGDERLERILEVKRDREKKRFFREPLKMMSEDPELSLYVTGPVAVLAFIIPFALGISAPTWEYFVEQPMVNTTFLFTLPFIILITPYTILYELKTRRNSRIMARFPDALKRLASANSIGMTLNEALEAVSENTSGEMGDQFEMVRNEIVWKYDVTSALVSFANRMRVQIVARTVKLLTEAAESTGDVENVLQVAAKDVNTQYRLKKKQAQNMMMYTVVILISFAVYLFVIVMLDTTFLQRLSGESFSASDAVGGETGSEGGGMPGGGGMGGGIGGGMSIDLSSVPVQQFRMVFFHSTIVQSIGSGLMAGQLGANDPKKGLKYTIALLIISTIVFLVLT